MPKRICLDSGHGGRDRSNRGPTGYIEADGALSIALACRRTLVLAGLDVIMTRADDVDLCPTVPYSQSLDLQARAEFANKEKADYFVSIHTNAAGTPSAKGTETFCYRWHTEGHKLALAIQDSVVSFLGTVSRGVKESNFAVLRLTSMPAALVEVAFHTNPDEEAKLKDPAFLKKAGEAIAVGIIKHLGLPQPVLGQEVENIPVEEIPTPLPAPENAPVEPPSGSPTSSRTSIVGQAEVSAKQAEAWARSRGATDVFAALPILYWYEAQNHGIRPEVAYAQAAKETAFGRFGGVITRDFCNWCGLKTREGGANDDPNAHARFPSDLTGVRAHIQHLCKYAGQPLPEGEAIVDPRYDLVTSGVAPYVEDLGGRWAPNPDYGVSIVGDYLLPMTSYKPMTECANCQALEAELKKVVDERDILKEKLARVREIVGG